ncbi:MAG: BlaI/MecI/CopY family transcriptional regulator [Planctomycetota bacterium]|nr:BlaI/MecI/CopY family transcriptional regulator [Planctomycetota bacterium]
MHRLGDLQLRIMQILWRGGPRTVADVQKQLAGNLAYTTVATMLRKMENRGLVCHNEQDRKFVYEPAVSSELVTRNMTGDLIDRLFAGNLPAVVNHLLTSREVSGDELDILENLIREHRRAGGGTESSP